MAAGTSGARHPVNRRSSFKVGMMTLITTLVHRLPAITSRQAAPFAFDVFRQPATALVQL